jgi:hypothetical protein
MMEINLAPLLNLEEQVAKLPEVGAPLLNRARQIQDDAHALIAVHKHMCDDFDDLVAEIQELWTKEERDGTIF